MNINKIQIQRENSLSAFILFENYAKSLNVF